MAVKFSYFDDVYYLCLAVSRSTSVNPILKLALSISTQFLQKFISWFTQSYETIIKAGLSSQQAWCLTTKLGECVFRTLQQSRAGVSNSIVLRDPRQIASVIWLTVEKTHDGIRLSMAKTTTLTRSLITSRIWRILRPRQIL